jgi:hypothetical protein
MDAKSYQFFEKLAFYVSPVNAKLIVDNTCLCWL